MAQLNVNRAEFVKSAASPESFVRDMLPRIVFAGKSNVGKSSVLNRLLNRKNFARVGATPGKTVHVNYFRIDGRCWFVDLPATATPARGQGREGPLGRADGELLLPAGADNAGRADS